MVVDIAPQQQLTEVFTTNHNHHWSSSSSSSSTSSSTHRRSSATIQNTSSVTENNSNTTMTNGYRSWANELGRKAEQILGQPKAVLDCPRQKNIDFHAQHPPRLNITTSKPSISSRTNLFNSTTVHNQLTIISSQSETSFEKPKQTITCEHLVPFIFKLVAAPKYSKVPEMISRHLSNSKEHVENIMESREMTRILHEETSVKLSDDENEEDDDDNNDDDDEGDESETTDVFKKLSKRFKQGDEVINEELNETYEHLIPERDMVLQKWFERTRGFTKQTKTNNPIEQSPVVQIKEIMSFPDRLLKRTQISRTDYDLVCPPSSPDHAETSTESTTKTNPELFDDGDFYHQLLREYVERKTASITDPEQISKHWAQLRKLRTKLKKNVDTKASKDRKIRYNVHKKLVNYMAPTDRCSFTDEAKSDLFSSLFGTTKLTINETEQTTPVNDIRII